MRAAAVAADRDRDGAAERLRRAAELAAPLATRPLLEQIVRLARRARIDLPPAIAGQAGPTVPFGLTAREMEVLRRTAPATTPTSALLGSPNDTGFVPTFDVATAVADYVAWRAHNPR